jgi:alanyl-tRNA synthetase
MALNLRNQKDNSVIALLSNQNERTTLVVAVSAAANALGAKAGELVKIGSAILGGGGGGKDDYAQGGGTESANINEAIGKIRATVAAL